MIEATQEVIDVVQKAGIPGQISHFVPRYGAWDKAEEMLEDDGGGEKEGSRYCL